eukprot:TRINITY_DN1764_c0_g1_i1.p1 TRINITY_DN1764_c0_g1~~TRINITY_DN1764_c0_g1_i1.p1  ORF type:complete len:404 (+),score=81.02 TRINITY_DN1764_c0_g1_i1:130-1341(+)
MDTTEGSKPFAVFLDAAPQKQNTSKRPHQDDPDLPVPNSNSKRKSTNGHVLQTLSAAQALQRSKPGYKHTHTGQDTDQLSSGDSGVFDSESDATIGHRSALQTLIEVATETKDDQPDYLIKPEAMDALRSSPAPVPQYLADPHRMMEYKEHILDYLHEFQMRYRPRHGYMRKQRDINYDMRTILVDWLVEVAQEYRLVDQTLHLTVAYVDRFLSEMAVQRGKLQLVGVTCMLLASKYEEIYPPCVEDFVYITDNTYTRNQVLKMEHVVLKVLQFNMGNCTALTFLDHFLTRTDATDEVRYLAKFLADLSLQDGSQFMEFKPSIMATACVVLALHTAGRSFWPIALQRASRADVDRMQLCVNRLHAAHQAVATSEQQSIREKYASSQYNRISTIHPAVQAPVLL